VKDAAVVPTGDSQPSALTQLIEAAAAGWSRMFRGRRGPTPARRNAATRHGHQSGPRGGTPKRITLRVLHHQARRRALTAPKHPCPSCLVDLAPLGSVVQCPRCRALIHFNKDTQAYQKRSIGWAERHRPQDHRIGVAARRAA
jgi:hypothetical protein